MTRTMTAERIWITGGSSGIGAALAVHLAKAGNEVIISGRSQEKLDAVCAEVPERIHAVVYDVGDRSQIEAVRQQLGSHLDRVVLNAGTCEYVDVEQFDPALFERVMATNFQGVVNSIAVALPLLRAASGRGHLAMVGSLSAYVGLTRAEAYGASKAALNYLGDTLRVDLWQQGIDVTVINPGFVDTPLTERNDFDMPFMVSAENAAERIAQGLAKRKTEIRFPAPLWLSLKLMAWLPTRWYVRLAQKMVR